MTLTLTKGKTVATIETADRAVLVLLSHDGYPNQPFTHRTPNPETVAADRRAAYLAAGFVETPSP